MQKDARIFYCPAVDGNVAVLSGEESWHCLKVLRKQKGDPVRFVDGQGGHYAAVIKKTDIRGCLLEVNARTFEKTPDGPALNIAIAPPKRADRFEWFLEKAVEIGVHSIHPVICERSERRIIKKDRSEKVMISAMKQSGRAWLPVIEKNSTFAEFVKNRSVGQKMLAHASGEDIRKCGLDKFAGELTCMIGPEGDFSDGEIATARENQFRIINLGPYRYRTETAGIMVCCYMNMLNRQSK